MNRFKMFTLVSVVALSGMVVSSVASATATDSFVNWSWGDLRVGDINQGADNDVYVTFRNPDGTVHNVWPNYAGTEICGRATSLRLARGRTNFKEIVDALSMAGLAGRPVWVGYEPVGGVCYIKTVTVTLRSGS
ncbi:hypothetical protein WMF38_26400 [Sorangium sp. So ce118]